MPDGQTKGQLEAKIAALATKFQREHMGRGPTEARAWIIEDMILIRLKGVLTPAEERLKPDSTGRHLLKQVRIRLVETSRDILDAEIEALTGVCTVSFHSDLSIRTGEQVLVVTLAEDLEARLRK